MLPWSFHISSAPVVKGSCIGLVMLVFHFAFIFTLYGVVVERSSVVVERSSRSRLHVQTTRSEFSCCFRIYSLFFMVPPRMAFVLLRGSATSTAMLLVSWRGPRAFRMRSYHGGHECRKRALFIVGEEHCFSDTRTLSSSNTALLVYRATVPFCTGDAFMSRASGHEALGFDIKWLVYFFYIRHYQMFSSDPCSRDGMQQHNCSCCQRSRRWYPSTSDKNLP